MMDREALLLILKQKVNQNLYLNRRRKLIGLFKDAMTKTILLFRILMNTAYLTLLLDQPGQFVRSCRRQVRNEGWFANCEREYNDENGRWKEAFRVSKKTFNYILSYIEADLQKAHMVECPISPAERLAICLFKLARGPYNFTMQEMVGHGESTIRQIVTEVCEAIQLRLQKKYVDDLFPTTDEAVEEAMVDMGSEWQFPQAFCAIDGSHIPIKCPPGGKEANKQYHNFKGFYSIIVLSLVDAKYRFLWNSVGATGNTHDSTLFQSTDIYEKLTDGKLHFEKAHKVKECAVPPLILGDGAFPLKAWLMKPFGSANVTEMQRNFNYRLSRARMVTECAFGLLKSRWRVLHRRCESAKDTTKCMALTCLILHNLTIEHKDVWPHKYRIDYDPKTNKRRPRKQVRDILNMTECHNRGGHSTVSDAATIRNALMDEFWNEKQSVNGVKKSVNKRANKSKVGQAKKRKLAH